MICKRIFVCCVWCNVIRTLYFCARHISHCKCIFWDSCIFKPNVKCVNVKKRKSIESFIKRSFVCLSHNHRSQMRLTVINIMKSFRCRYHWKKKSENLNVWRVFVCSHLRISTLRYMNSANLEFVFFSFSDSSKFLEKRTISGWTK